MKYMRRPNSTAVKDSDINTANILSRKYRYRIDIGKGDIDPPLTNIVLLKIVRLTRPT